jgi:protein TonB
MLKAVLLALCLDAVLMLALVMLPEAPDPASPETVSSKLLVKLGTPSRASSVSSGAANANPDWTVPPTAAQHSASSVSYPVSAASIPAAAQIAAAETVAAQTEAKTATHEGSRPDEPLPDRLAGGSASSAYPGDADGMDEAAASAPSGADHSAELVLRIDALVRERLIYPPLARRRNIEGVVKVTLLIDEYGRLDGRTLVQSSGSSILDRAAIALVEEIFPLSLAGGLEKPVHISIMVSYSLTS